MFPTLAADRRQRGNRRTNLAPRLWQPAPSLAVVEFKVGAMDDYLERALQDAPDHKFERIKNE
jgi:hypothetical protein